MLDDEYDDDGSDYGFSGTYYFPALSLHFYNYVGHISGLRSIIFVPTGDKSKCDIFAFVVFIPIGVKYKVGQLIKIFWRLNSLFSLHI